MFVTWWYWLVLGSARSVWGGVLTGTWWYWVIIERNWLIHDGNGSEKGSTGLYLVVLSQYVAVLVGTWWYWVNITWYCLVLSGTGLV